MKKLSDAEWTVMKVVWEKPPVTVRDVYAKIQDETEWAYSTVKTIMDRLVEKGVLSSTKRANTGLFEPLITRSQARKSAIQSLVERAFDGTFGSLLQHMISEEKLSRRDQKRLQELLEESKSVKDSKND